MQHEDLSLITNTQLNESLVCGFADPYSSQSGLTFTERVQQEEGKEEPGNCHPVA